MSDDTYKAWRARLVEAHSISSDPLDPDPVRTELDRRRLCVDHSDWLDLPDHLRATAKLIDQTRTIVAWGRAANKPMPNSRRLSVI